MSFDPLPEESLRSVSRLVGPAFPDPLDSRTLLDRLKPFPVYGLLLLPDPAHPLARLVAERWDGLNHMTGPKFLLLAFQAPETFSEDFAAAWRKQLGADFAPVWDKWTAEKVTGAAAYDYARMFDGTQIRRADMPCLALFTDAQAHRAAIVPLPDWSPDDLWTLLQSICDTIDDCAGEADPEQRLQRLQRELASFPARASRTLGHLAGKAADYAKAHPVKVVTVTLNVAVAMATAGLIPIGATAVTFIKDLLGIIKDA